MPNPLDALAEHVKMRLCPCISRYGLVCFHCAPTSDSNIVIHGANCLNSCSEEGAVLNPGDPVFQALWKMENILCEDKTCFAGGKHKPDRANSESSRIDHLHPEYVRRSRAESALLLPDAATKDGNGVTIRGFSAWEVALHGGPHSGVGKADNWLNALAAAILEARKFDAKS